MIRLNIQMFAKSASAQRSYRASKRKAEFEKMAAELKEKQEKGEEPVAKKSQGYQGQTLPNNISSRQTYEMVQVQRDGSERVYGEREGTYIRDLIAHETLQYNSKAGLYQRKKAEEKDGKKTGRFIVFNYIIRKKK